VTARHIRRVIATAVACTLVAIGVAVGLVAPADAGGSKLTAGRYSGLTTKVLQSGACGYEAFTWAWEHGMSGVTRLRTRYELRGLNDPGFLPTYAKTGYATSGFFANDARSYSKNFHIAHTLVSPPGATYSVWAKAVGERPSFWQRDLVVKMRLGATGCENELPTGRNG
jgi:hypothetical protein